VVNSGATAPTFLDAFNSSSINLSSLPESKLNLIFFLDIGSSTSNEFSVIPLGNFLNGHSAKLNV
jgi:hypothetical protein